MMRAWGTAVLLFVLFVIHTIFTVPALSQTCQANAVGAGSEFNFAGSSTVTIAVGGYPSSFAVALKAGSAIWNDDQTCPGKEIPIFNVDTGNAPPTSTTSDQMRLIFSPDRPAPFDPVDGVYDAAQVDHEAGVVRVFGKCPPDEGTTRAPTALCNSNLRPPARSCLRIASSWTSFMPWFRSR